MKAGASSMWASCCGLLNEVIGTGAVRSQPPGFGGGAGPFRFAPSAGYSAYPPTSPASSGSGLVCKACGLAFSVFRRKHVCCDCKKSFCSLCSVLQENLRRCTTCHLLWGTAFQRPRLMRLRVKDLRQYLTLRNINTETCREKEDLVDLVLCHLGAQLGPGDEEEDEEEEADTDSVHSHLHSVVTPPPSAARSASQQSALSNPASQGEAPSPSNSPSNSSGTSQDRGELASVSLLYLEPSERLLGLETSPVIQRRARASLSDLSQEDDIENLTVRQLKEILARNFVNFSGCCEKWELVERVHRLYRENENNRTSSESREQIHCSSESRSSESREQIHCSSESRFSESREQIHCSSESRSSESSENTVPVRADPVRAESRCTVPVRAMRTLFQ